MKYLTISFFGHRYLNNVLEIKERLTKQLQFWYSLGARKFKIGMHGQFDKLALEECLAFKKTNGDVDIYLTVTSFSSLQKEKESNSLLDYYHQMGIKTVIYEIENIYFKQQIIYSNCRMIDESDVIICYVNLLDNKSGAKRAVDYASKQNKTVINLYKDTDNPFYGKDSTYINNKVKEYLDK